MNVEEIAVSIKNPTIIFYGPHPCDLCGGGPIVRGSVNQGFGDIRLDSPNEPIYPNRKWEEHKCGCSFHVGQKIEWDGQEETRYGEIATITQPFPGNYVLWIDDIENGFPVNASIVRPRRDSEAEAHCECPEPMLSKSNKCDFCGKEVKANA